MPAETLQCPMCGAAAASDASRCEHCGARLATVACPSCFGLIFQGAKFCSHCGAKVERAEVTTATPLQCPHCRVDMEKVLVGTTNLLECAECEGLWVDADTLQQICADREKQAAVLGLPGTPPEPETDEIKPIHYWPCPVCQTLMNRVNFAHCSHVVVDVCRQHGTWFDQDELRKVVEFIRAGGLEKAREREIEDLKDQRSRLQTARATGVGTADFSDVAPRRDGFDLAMGALGAALKGLLG